MCGDLHIGDLVVWRGRTYRLCGFDPMSVVDVRVHLEDEDTGERVVVPAAEVDPSSPSK